jgi:hypothetical protein
VWCRPAQTERSAAVRVEALGVTRVAVRPAAAAEQRRWRRRRSTPFACMHLLSCSAGTTRHRAAGGTAPPPPRAQIGCYSPCAGN